MTQSIALGEAAAPARASSAGAERIVAIDALRGTALVLMALDHASFFAGAGLQAESYGGQPVALQSSAYWGSGLLTNLASPIFWLLGGYSLALFAASQRRKGRSEWVTTRYMLVRAAIILALDLTICAWFWLGSTPYVHVLTTMAVGMALLSLLRFLPNAALLGGTLLVMLAYQFYLGANASSLAAGAPQSLGQAFWLTYSYETRPVIGFAVLGWAPLMWLGFALGRQQRHAAMRSPRTWLLGGLGLLLLWLVLRLAGGFGDLGPFGAVGASPAHFLIMAKAPPSLSYLAFNLGLSALLLALFYTRSAWISRGLLAPLLLVGQVSLFFYVAHIVIYHLVARVVLAGDIPGPRIVWGYLAFGTGLALLLPLCAGYRRLRKRYPQVLGYL
jgi:uncharacterized membrane protein